MRYFTIFLWTLVGMAISAAGQTKTHVAGPTLKVMTYNIHHANPPSRAKDSLIDLPAVARVINSAGVDLVALQELDVNNERAGVQVNELAELARLTKMYYFFARAIDYRGGAYGVGVLSRWPILDTMRYELPMAPGVKGETRALCVVKVRVPGGATAGSAGQEILFASTHLDQHREPESRVLQARTIAGIVRMYKEPFILGGDLNDFPESRTLQVLDSVFVRSCYGEACPLTIPVDPPKRTIDFILYTPPSPFESLGVKTVPETYASDHLPVVAEIRIK